MCGCELSALGANSIISIRNGLVVLYNNLYNLLYDLLIVLQLFADFPYPYSVFTKILQLG